MGTSNIRQPEIVFTDPPEVIAEKFRLAVEIDKELIGVPSLCDQPLEDPRLERERELAAEGW